MEMFTRNSFPNYLGICAPTTLTVTVHVRTTTLFLVLPAHFSGVTRGQARSSEVRTVGHSISVCLCQGKAHGSITETDGDEDQCWNRMFIGAMLFVAHRQRLLALNGNNAYYMYGDISDELRSSPL